MPAGSWIYGAAGNSRANIEMISSIQKLVRFPKLLNACNSYVNERLALPMFEINLSKSAKRISSGKFGWPNITCNYLK
jgi:hypothetical protein